MTISPRRQFFRNLALVGGLAALGSAVRVTAQTVSNAKPLDFAGGTILGQDITCDNGMPAFLACPAGRGPFPTVILMHERYGLVQHTRDQAMRCARDGYAVMAPNFFFHHPDQAALNAGKARYDLTDPESVELIKAALAGTRSKGKAMASRIRSAKLENRSVRLRLPLRKKPYSVVIMRGVHLLYRRNKTAGPWMVRVCHSGEDWTEPLGGVADDYDEADGKHVLTFWQAQDLARP
jgi:hypothetical protein